MRYILNQSSGIISELDEKQVDLLRDYEIVLTQKPKPSCKQCHGRGFIGRNEAKIMWVPCFKCLKKCVDKEMLAERVKAKVNQHPVTIQEEAPQEVF